MVGTIESPGSVLGGLGDERVYASGWAGGVGYGAVVGGGREMIQELAVVEEGDCGDLVGYASQGSVVAAATAAQAVPGAVNGEGGD